MLTGVGLKMDIQKNNNLICHCFNYTREDIGKDYLKNGHSLIYDKIALEKKAGKCDCQLKNPKGH